MTRWVLEALGRFCAARLRQLGLASIYPHWQARAALCEKCPLCVVRCGVSYCGTPLLLQIDRDPIVDGCGCPCHDKAKSPSEHCPIDSSHRAAETTNGQCSCKWCREMARLGLIT